jgi:hypothetical protein
MSDAIEDAVLAYLQEHMNVASTVPEITAHRKKITLCL